ncbi:replication initiation protein (plasmid) [Burkholderia gladioli]|uniref:replication initiation protein n=1 Tax=Burkholderia gladioli TaxID=28095 RepID=UPI001640A024|nr:replication initiation protein [Burkholderia gladioli]MDN7755047.1 replication initiation protein [Burkholderia gladioli]QPQ89140.1 replication initiation protein [Burkholderia gladioli]
MAPAKQKSGSTAIASIKTSELRKHVGTVHVGGDLGLLGRKISNVLLLNAYDDLLKRTVHKIPVGIMSEMLGFDSKNTGALKEALKKIATTPIEFDILHAAGDEEWGVTTLLSSANIRNGMVSYEYSRELANRLANPEIYLLININVQKQFSGSYALALYENCLRFKRTGSTGWIEVEIWRRLLGAEAATYDEFKHFNAEVIKKAVKEVNTVSNIQITPEYERQSRRVTKIRFLVEDNPQRSMYDDSDSEEHAAIRQSETYRRLTKLGIAGRLAVDWIQNDPERASKTAAYVEQQMREKKIRKNAGGYARTVFEGGGDIETVEYLQIDAATAAASSTASASELATDARANKLRAAIRALEPEQVREYVRLYAEAGGPVTSYREADGAFKNAIEKASFTAWLSSKIGESFA